jgi:hypothetical protein
MNQIDNHHSWPGFAVAEAHFPRFVPVWAPLGSPLVDGCVSCAMAGMT